MSEEKIPCIYHKYDKCKMDKNCYYEHSNSKNDANFQSENLSETITISTKQLKDIFRLNMHLEKKIQILENKSKIAFNTLNYLMILDSNKKIITNIMKDFKN